MWLHSNDGNSKEAAPYQSLIFTSPLWASQQSFVTMHVCQQIVGNCAIIDVYN